MSVNIPRRMAKHKVFSPKHQNALWLGIPMDYTPRGYSDVTKYELQFIGKREYRFSPLLVAWGCGTRFSLGEFICGMMGELKEK